VRHAHTPEKITDDPPVAEFWDPDGGESPSSSNDVEDSTIDAATSRAASPNTCRRHTAAPFRLSMFDMLDMLDMRDMGGCRDFGLMPPMWLWLVLVRPALTGAPP
jgi:hypothetical protein